MHSVLSFLLQFFLEDLARDLWIRNDCWCTGLSVYRSQQSRPRVRERWIRGLETICQESVRIPPPPWIADKVWSCGKRKVRWWGSPWWTLSKLHLSPPSLLSFLMITQDCLCGENSAAPGGWRGGMSMCWQHIAWLQILLLLHSADWPWRGI